MLRLHYSDGFVITADDVASAVMDYARVLAMNGTSDVITIPIVDEEGNAAESQLLIGPASQLHTTPIPEPGVPIDGSKVIAELSSKAEKLERGPVAAVSRKADDDGDESWEMDGSLLM